ncbi:unnamed protein product [Kuraishia capsulata CBS 1993]|uniref:BRO domain-containing protein 1 n=1 Tax=Kuraishia capsulata CBS 1993 TaxID=1382522 RepID=W6MVZ4_9ASCO|nr:uncharacterized protein KUCA_T00002664001 [Kuraishia capsulata CBS 1993]CDK26690.1 unnamed protein product [Kuraishia capsulata CBS 1993]
MKTPVITIPLKKTEEVDWSKPLQSYLARVYGSSDEYHEGITTFNKLRSDMTGAGRDSTGRDLLYRYYGQLELLDLRIPVDQHGGVNVTFTWFDAFRPASSSSQHSLAFEKVSVLFNLAAVLSHLGADYLDDDDLKLSYQAFQWSAGILQFISENFLHAPSNDLHQDTIKALTKLMLAQAQEVFVLRLLLGDSQTKPSLLARLAKSCSVFYGLAKDGLDEVSSKGVDVKWSAFAKLKTKHYLSVAHYYQALNSKASGKYGVAIFHAREARDDSKEKAVFLGVEMFTKLNAVTKKWAETVKNELTELEKDNDYIYHDVIPTTVPEIKPMDSAAPVPLNKQNVAVVTTDLFEKIVPMAVHEQESYYSEEKAKLLRNESGKITVADEELESVLEFLRLPKSLADIRELLRWNGSSPPDDDDDDEEVDPRVLSVSLEVSSSRLDSSSVSNTRSQIYPILQNCDTLLDNEEKTFTSNKTQYGSGWSQTPSDSFSLKEEIARIKKSLADAASSDQKLLQLIDEYQSELDVLKLGPQSQRLKDVFTKPKPADSQSVSLVDLDDSTIVKTKAKVEQVDSKVQELYYLKKERQNTYNDLKELVHKDDISNILILNKKMSNMDKVFSEELSKFRPYQDRIDATVEKQEPLVNEIKALMGDILQDETVKRNRKLQKAQNSSKKSLVSRYLQAYDSWKQYNTGLEQATKFYSQLLNYAHDVRSKVETYVRSRSEQSALLSNSFSSQERDQYALREHLSRLSINGGISPGNSRSGSLNWQPQPQQPAHHQAQIYEQQPPLPAKPGSFSYTNGYQPPPPPKPQGMTGVAPISGYSSLQPPQQNNANVNAPSGSFYSTPSVYDPALYSKFSQNS